VPIISLARGSASAEPRTAYIPMDEKQVGRDIASWTARHIGDKGKVAFIVGPAGAPTFRNLEQGYAEVMKKTSQQSTSCSRTTAR